MGRGDGGERAGGGGGWGGGVVCLVCAKHMACRFYRHSLRLIEQGAGGWPAIARVAGDSTDACDRGDDAAGDFAHHVLRIVCDVNAVVAVDCEPPRIVEFGAGGGPAVAAIPTLPAVGYHHARKYVDDASRVDHADRAAIGVGNVDVAETVFGHAKAVG